MRGFDAGVDRQDIGLERHRVDDFDDFARACRATFHFVHGLAQRMCRSDTLPRAVIGAGGQRDDLRQFGIDVLQARRQPLHRGARAVQRLVLGLRLAHHFIVFGHQRWHSGGDLHRQGHCLADGLGQIAEPGLQPPAHLGFCQSRRQQEFEFATGQRLGSALEHRAVFVLGLQARNQRLQQGRDRHRPAAVGQTRGLAQQDRGFHMRQRQHPAAMFAIAYIAHALRRVVARGSPDAVFANQVGGAQPPHHRGRRPLQLDRRFAQHIQADAVAGHHTRLRRQPQQGDRRIREHGHLGLRRRIGLLHRIHEGLLLHPVIIGALRGELRRGPARRRAQYPAAWPSLRLSEAP